MTVGGARSTAACVFAIVTHTAGLFLAGLARLISWSEAGLQCSSVALVHRWC